MSHADSQRSESVTFFLLIKKVPLPAYLWCTHLYLKFCMESALKQHCFKRGFIHSQTFCCIWPLRSRECYALSLCSLQLIIRVALLKWCLKALSGSLPFIQLGFVTEKLETYCDVIRVKEFAVRLSVIMNLTALVQLETWDSDKTSSFSQTFLNTHSTYGISVTTTSLVLNSIFICANLSATWECKFVRKKSSSEQNTKSAQFVRKSKDVGCFANSCQYIEKAKRASY